MKLYTCLSFCSVLAISSAFLPSLENDVLKEVDSALRNITTKNGIFNPEEMSLDARAKLYAISNINIFDKRPKEPVWPYYDIDCDTCLLAATLLIDLFQAGTPLWEIEVAVTSLCIVLEIEMPEVCEGSVHNYGYQVEYILQHMSDPAPELLCGVFVGGECGDQTSVNGWEVEIPELPEKPAVTVPEDPDETISELRVLQITDVHIDMSYLPGSPVNCGLPCCCMAETGLAGEGEAGAGFWGDYNCDLPVNTFQEIVRHIAATHTDLDYIIYTGDSPAHDIWLQTKERNLEHQEVVLSTLDQHLPGIPVYLPLGNHEGFPVNSFPTNTELGTVVSGDWLYNSVGDLAWANNLDEEARETFKQNGFYSTLVKPGLRIIGINNNFCVGLNFFTFLDFSDPGDQLSWLVKQLLLSEEQGEAVHILAHHPPSSCLSGWGREYTKIINRFQSTVKAQFHGHTHDDHYLVFHNETGGPSSIAFVAPSLTTFTNNNPEYRIYNVASNLEHSSFGHITDHQTWSMDLSLLNSEDDIPEWRQLYSAQEDLGLGGVDVSKWKAVLETANDDMELFEKLVVYYSQDRFGGSLPNKKNFLCRMIWNEECPFED